MTDVLLGIAILLLLGALALLLALWKRQARGGSPVEGELRGRIGDLEAEAGALRGRVETERGARLQAETRLESERKNLADQRALLDEAQAKLKDAFKALSSDALTESRQQFLGQAAERMKPIQDLLKTYEEHLREIEKIRSDAYGGLKSQLETLTQAHQGLQKEAHTLSQALRSPTVRGRWGEVTLKRVVEVAGMSAYCDFDTQVSAAGGEDDALQRPDMIVKLPNHRTIVVDSKAPLDAYLEAADAADEPARKAALARHAQAVRSRMKALGQQSYWRRFQPAPDFVVLFLPAESFFSAALDQDRALIEDGMKEGVVLATPTTLIALLKAVAYGWRQEEMAENAARIAEAGRQLYDRLCKFTEHLAKVGKGLKQASQAYDDMIGSYDRMLLPGTRRLAELGASSGKDLPEVPTVEGPTRSLPEGGTAEE